MKNKFGLILPFSFLIALVFNPYGHGVFELPKLHILAIFLSLILIGIAIYFFFKGQLTIRYHKIVFLFLIVWLLSLVLSTIFSMAPNLSFYGSYERFQGLYSHLIYLGFFLLFLNFLKEKGAQEFTLKVLIGIALVTSLHAILQKFGIGLLLPEESKEFLGRSFATLGHPNYLGQFLLFPIWAGIYFFLKNFEKRKKSLWIISGAIALVMISALVLTENRASMLGLVTSILFVILFSRSVKKIYKYILSGALLLGFLGVIFFYAPGLRSLFSRFSIWESGLGAFLENPLIGSGLETFKLIFQKFVSADLHDVEKLYDFADRAHNEYLDILVMQGILGLVVYLSAIAGIFVLYFKKLKTKISPLMVITFAAFISILVTNFFSFSLSIHYLSLTLILALFLNSTAKFKEVKVKNSILPLFASILVIILSVFYINVSVRTIYADILLENGGKDFSIGDLENGTLSYKKAIELNPHQSEIYFNFVDDLHRVGLQAESAKLLQKTDKYIEEGGKFTNQDFVYYLFKTRLETDLGNFEQAEATFEEGKIAAGNHPLFVEQWGHMHYLAKDYEKAAAKLEEFISLLPVYWQWALNLEAMSTPDQEKYRIFMKHVPNFNLVILELADSYEKLNQLDKAAYYLQFLNKF